MSQGRKTTVKEGKIKDKGRTLHKQAPQKKVIKQVKDPKAQGLDGITPETIKAFPETATALPSYSAEEEKEPSNYAEGHQVKLSPPKKTQLKDCKNKLTKKLHGNHVYIRSREDSR